MRYGVLGTGVVGRTLGSGLLQRGHEVTMGGRSADNEAATAWAAQAESGAAHGTFADAARAGEVLINATAGTASLAALATVDPADLAGKVLIDVSNPLDFSAGFPPMLALSNDSVGEQLQRAHPDLRVVKALNTVNAEVMTAPDIVPGDHAVFVCGEDAAAKAQVVELLGSLGWPPQRVLDLGGIGAARGTEAYLALWVRMMGVLGTPRFNVAVLRG